MEKHCRNYWKQTNKQTILYRAAPKGATTPVQSWKKIPNFDINPVLDSNFRLWQLTNIAVTQRRIKKPKENCLLPTIKISLHSKSFHNGRARLKMLLTQFTALGGEKKDGAARSSCSFWGGVTGMQYGKQPKTLPCARNRILALCRISPRRTGRQETQLWPKIKHAFMSLKNNLKLLTVNARDLI